jgi:hypothetical protein
MQDKPALNPESQNPPPRHAGPYVWLCLAAGPASVLYRVLVLGQKEQSATESKKRANISSSKPIKARDPRRGDSVSLPLRPSRGCRIVSLVGSPGEMVVHRIAFRRVMECRHAAMARRPRPGCGTLGLSFPSTVSRRDATGALFRLGHRLGDFRASACPRAWRARVDHGLLSGERSCDFLARAWRARVDHGGGFDRHRPAGDAGNEARARTPSAAPC